MFVLESVATMVCCFGWLNESEKREKLQLRNLELKKENRILYEGVERLCMENIRQRSEISILRLNAKEEKKDV